ncbi:MAG TPA: serine/threonine-protein kinase, partial [Kofleriaceae bacterium]|nr:serine/threonine-protein kinase [Kofleriaceae bacterium]
MIAETYKIEALIGRGGMGAVFLASHRRLPGKKVAIKLLHAELTDEEVVARFRREALITSQLNHPNIVDVTDFNVTPEGAPYLVLEYLHGESLAQRIKLGPMQLEQVLSIIRQVGSAVAAAHREGIIHRDLKPQNIFLVPKEVDGRILEIAKVLDFGISKIRGSQTVKTQESTLLGTPQYMAPEQATGQHASVDERTDVFALGAIVYEMLSSEPAFSGANIPEVVFKVVYEEPTLLAVRVPGVPPEIAAAVARAMAKSAADRFPSVSAFVEAMTGQPLLQLRPGSLAPPEVGFAAGSAHRNTGHDAFAQTMGSAVGGAAAIAPPSTAATAIDAQARTMPSSPGGTAN